MTIKEAPLSLGPKYLQIVSKLLPTGVVGLSLLLASTAASAAREHPMKVQPPAAQSPRVAERLAAIRDAVSTVVNAESGTTQSQDPGEQLAWGNWGNGFFPLPIWPWSNWNNWHNWNNWGNFWHNW